MIPTKATKNSYKSKNSFNYQSKPVFPIQIDQSLSVISLQISQYGKMGGVIFIQTSKGSFVLKANNQPSQNFFYNQLALMLDVNVPLMTTLACYDPQFTKLVYLIQKYCHQDEVLYARLKPKLDFPFYEIIEYIPSIMPVHVGKNKFAKHMISDYKLYSLGMVIAYDMIINNPDRFRLIWRSSGNLNNVLIEIINTQKQMLQKARDREDESVPLGNFAFIDNQGYMIDPSNSNSQKNMQNYMQKITQFQLNMIQYLRKQNSSLPQQYDKLTNQMYDLTQYKLTDEDIVKICEGIVYSTKKFIILYESGEVKNLYESIPKPTDTKKKQTNYWNEYWNNLFKKVSLVYCEWFYIKISAIYTTYPELINQIYEKVRKVVEANKNLRRRRVSKNSRKNSQISNKNQQDLGAQGQGQGNGEQELQEKFKEDEEKDNQQKRKRKWREKLQVFRKQNYRE